MKKATISWCLDPESGSGLGKTWIRILLVLRGWIWFRFNIRPDPKRWPCFSLFVGRVVGIDWSDGSGMNLLNITNKTWVPQVNNF